MSPKHIPPPDLFKGVSMSKEYIVTDDGATIYRLVRCKDCKWAKTIAGTDERLHCSFHCRSCKPRDYCSEGVTDGNEFQNQV